MAFNNAQVVALQAGSDLVPTPHGFETVTNPITTVSSARTRLAHFAEEVYDLSAESHIVKLLKVLLGGAGVGGKQRALILCRMQQALGSTHFFDLDAFYGAILGARRNYKEQLECDPRYESCDLEMWDRAQIRDGEYRSRVARFAAALHRGCTIEGIRGVAEAMLGERCDIFEGWMHPITAFRTWASTDTFTWAQTDAMTWPDMEYDATAGIPVARNLITLRPAVPLDLGEIYDLERALDRIKPASAFVDVVPSIGSHAQTIDGIKVYADSSRWDVRQEVRNVRFNGLLLSPNDPEGAFIPTQVPAWARYQGEAWSLLVSGPKTVAWSTPVYPVVNKTVDPKAVQTPPQQVKINDKPVSFVTEYALLDVQKIMAGRAASEAIVSELAYARKPQDSAPGMPMQMVNPSTPAVRDSSLGNQATLTIDGLGMVGQATLPPSLVRQATFWCSPARLPDGTTVDALEVRFDKEVTANKVTMKVSNFPATVTVEYWNAVTGRWGRIGRTTINRAVPYMITGAMNAGDLHPQHRGTGHWVPLNFETPNVTTSLFRVLFDRIPGYGPVGTGNRQTAYSVAVRDIDIGFRIASIRSVPSAFPLEPVSTTINTWGVDIVHKLHISSPASVLDGNRDTAWVCDAQETNDAIVNFYIDVSTANAQPRVIDELYMIPTHLGPVFNLYYSQTDPATVDVANLEVEDRPIDPIAIIGGVTPISSGDAGVLFSDFFESYIDLDANDVGFTTLPKDWWTGIQFYITQESPGRVVLYSWGSKSIYGYNVGSIELWWNQITARVGNYQATVTMSKPPYKGQRISLVLIVKNMIPELYIYEQRGQPPTTGEGEALSTMTVEALTGAIVSMANVETNLTHDGLIMDGTVPAAQFAYGGNALAPNASLGIDIKLQVDLATHSGVAETLAGKSSIGWEVKRTNPDGLSLTVYLPGAVTATSTAATMKGKWWIWINRDNDTGAVTFQRAAWSGDDIPDVWEPMGTPSTTAGVPVTTPGTFPVGGTSTAAQGFVKRVVLGEYPNAPTSFDVSFELFAAGDEISLVRFGSSGEADGYRMVKMAMGLGSVLPDQFALYPESYTYNTPGVGLEQPNIFLRYHPSYYGHLTDNGLSWGFMGAILEPWDGMTWAPIGQYAFTRGTIEFNEVRARFLKLEISQLIIEPYDSFTVKARKVKRVIDSKMPPTGRSTTPGAQSIINTIGIPRYPDQTEQLFMTQPNNTLSPTAGLVVRDSVQRAEIGAKAGYGFALTTWQSSSMMPLKDRVGLHYYQTVLVQPTARTAYFCGFKELRVRRRNPRDFGDTAVYFDTLLTDDNIRTDQMTMNLEPGQAFTTEHATNSVMLVPQYINSKVFYSYTSVDALQIATQQTGPVQIIPDDEFSSPSLSGLSFTDPATWHATGDAAVVWDTKIGGPRVTRDPDVISAIAVQDTPIVAPPVTPIVDSIAEEGNKNVGYGEFGGISSPLVAVSPYGTLYLGARVFCDKDIGDDLFLRLYGADELTVLAELQFRPATNVTTEVFLDYVLGSNLALETSVQVRIEQHGPNVSSWIMQALSCFDSSVLFEVSNDGGATWMPCNDVRNRRYGVVEFPTAGSAIKWRMTAYRHNYVLDAVKLRPWYFRRLGSAV